MSVGVIEGGNKFSFARASSLLRHVTVKRVVAVVPTAIGVACLIAQLARFTTLVHHLYWDSDAAMAPVMAQTYHGADISIGRFGWFTSFWFMLLTRSFPLHRVIWEGAPLFFSLAAAGVLSFASYKIAGKFAAAMTAVLILCVCPTVAYDFATLNYHTTTWLPMVLMGTSLLWLTKKHSAKSLIAYAIAMSIVAGTASASDLLFVFAALIPFTIAASTLFASKEQRHSGYAAVATVIGSIAIWRISVAAMKAANITVIAAPTVFAQAKDIMPALGRLLQGIMQNLNGNYFMGQPIGIRALLSLACGVVAVLAIAAPFLLIKHHIHSFGRTLSAKSYELFWAASISLLALSFCFSVQGANGASNYVIPMLFATAATLPLLLSRTTPQKITLGAVVSLVALTSFINTLDSKTYIPGGKSPIALASLDIVKFATEDHATRGYGDYGTP